MPNHSCWFYIITSYLYCTLRFALIHSCNRTVAHTVRGKQITAIHTLYGLHVISCVLHVVAAFALYAVLFAIYVAAWLKQSSMLLTSLTCALDPPPLLQQAQRDAMMGRKLGVVRLSGLLHLEERPAYQEIARQLCRWDWMQGARER